MKISKLSLMLILVLLISAWDNPEELFEGEMYLKICYLDIPLNYTKKSDKIVAEKAKELQGRELVLLQFNKSTKGVNYKRYYLVSQLSKNGSTIFNYLIPSENYEDYKKGKIVAVFLKFRPKYDRFYLSTCFDSIMNNHPEILSKWIKK